MSATVYVHHMFAKVPKGSGITVVNTTSNATNRWESGLSPFILGPCDLWGGYSSQNMENGHQYSKCYAEHVDKNEDPTEEWWKWAKAGWANKKAVRYPMGKGRKPLYAYWEGKKLGYIVARKTIYGPLYIKAVLDNPAWEKLVCLYETSKELYLRDYDAYDHRKRNMNLSEVLNCPDKIMGHAFVLAMLLTKDKALKEFKC